jgi:hypothetical protein
MPSLKAKRLCLPTLVLVERDHHRSLTVRLGWAGA